MLEHTGSETRRPTGRLFQVFQRAPIWKNTPEPVAAQESAKRPRQEETSDLPPVKIARCANSPLPKAPSPVSTVCSGIGERKKLVLTVQTQDGKETVVSMLLTRRFSSLYHALMNQFELPEDSFKLLWSGQCLMPDMTPLDYPGLEEYGEVADLIQLQRGGKPVIYLFPPSALPSVQVDLTLVPEWTLSALYPVAEIHRGKGGKSTTSWTVSASPDGTLVDKASSLSLSYLFWEAHAPLLPPSPPLLPQDAVAPSLSAFNPGRPSINRSNSALLPFTAFLSHLDAALSSLTLHTSARNDFITYWLPHFIRIRDKGEQIAFRFLPQVEYEQAAELKVEPKPDVVTRVFLLFKGVKKAEQEGWLEAQEMDWVKEVGVKAEARKAKLFRCLEWGGMEVLSA